MYTTFEKCSALNMIGIPQGLKSRKVSPKRHGSVAMASFLGMMGTQHLEQIFALMHAAKYGACPLVMVLYLAYSS